MNTYHWVSWAGRRRVQAGVVAFGMLSAQAIARGEGHHTDAAGETAAPNAAADAPPEHAPPRREDGTVAGDSVAKEPATRDVPAAEEAGDSPPLGDLETELPVTAIGALSVGHPHAGYLFNGVQLPKDPRWVRTVPELSWATEETIAALRRCIGRVHEEFPGSPPVMIGAISARLGGSLPPHKSHRTGRDVDVYLFRTGGKWYRAATAQDLDMPRTWALLRAFATEADVDMILLDRKLQVLLETYAKSIGEDPAWVDDLFHGHGRYPNPLVKHVPGHVAHMHVRFASPIARERGRLAYDQLVELGHIELPSREVRHEVAAGDTLIAIAKRYNTTVDTIARKNGLASTTIRVGQKLVIRERKDLRDARAPVVVPPRRLPPFTPRPGARRNGVHAQGPAAPPKQAGSRKASPPEDASSGPGARGTSG